MQALYALALGPITEATADIASFGFRKYRSAQVRKQNRKSESWTTSGELNENKKMILKLAGFDEKIYAYSINIKNVEE